MVLDDLGYNIYLIGGANPSGNLDDMWTFDIVYNQFTLGQWKWLSGTGAVNTPRMLK